MGRMQLGAPAMMHISAASRCAPQGVVVTDVVFLQLAVQPQHLQGAKEAR